jgi:hypothetical protein
MILKNPPRRCIPYPLKLGERMHRRPQTKQAVVPAIKEFR